MFRVTKNSDQQRLQKHKTANCKQEGKCNGYHQAGVSSSNRSVCFHWNTVNRRPPLWYVQWHISCISQRGIKLRGSGCVWTITTGHWRSLNQFYWVLSWDSHYYVWWTCMGVVATWGTASTTLYNAYQEIWWWWWSDGIKVFLVFWMGSIHKSDHKKKLHATQHSFLIRVTKAYATTSVVALPVLAGVF